MGCGLRPNQSSSMTERSGWQTQHGRTHFGQRRTHYGRDKGAKPHSVPPATDTCDRNHTIPSPIHHRPAPRNHCVALPSASRDIPAQSPAPHSHIPSSRPTNSTIAETNLNSPNNVFSLPFSLTSQTATHRLSITYPYSSNYPFFGFVNPARHHAAQGLPATAPKRRCGKITVVP